MIESSIVIWNAFRAYVRVYLWISASTVIERHVSIIVSVETNSKAQEVGRYTYIQA